MAGIPQHPLPAISPSQPRKPPIQNNGRQSVALGHTETRDEQHCRST
jgi:hypothetical protein